jgi:hypothetical protein
MPAGSIHFDGPITEPQPPEHMALVTQPTHLPEPAPEKSEEGRSLVQINRIRRSLIQAVEDFQADIATQRDNVRTAAAMFGDPQHDGTDRPQQSVAVQTARLNELLAELAAAKVRLAAHVDQYPTAEEIDARITALRRQEFENARDLTLLAFRTHAETAIQHVLDAEAALNEASALAIHQGKFFRNPQNAKELCSLILDQYPEARLKGGAKWLKAAIANQI